MQYDKIYQLYPSEKHVKSKVDSMPATLEELQGIWNTVPWNCADFIFAIAEFKSTSEES